MSGYLLDTSVVSILGPGRSDATDEFIDWVRTHSGQLHICSVTVAEITQGIAKLTRSNGLRRAEELTQWRERLLRVFEARTLSLDVATAIVAGTLADEAYAKGRHPGVADVMIAATARAHDLTLLTRDIRHFEPLGIAVIDPLVNLPD